MARRRINNSKRRKEWRRYRAEELTRLRTLWMDAKKTFERYERLSKRDSLVFPFSDHTRERSLVLQLSLRVLRRWNAYRAELNDR